MSMVRCDNICLLLSADDSIARIANRPGSSLTWIKTSDFSEKNCSGGVLPGGDTAATSTSLYRRPSKFGYERNNDLYCTSLQRLTLSLGLLYFGDTIGGTHTTFRVGDKVQKDLRFRAPAYGFCPFESLGDVDS